MEKYILEFLGKIVAIGGGAAAIAYMIFVFLGKKWIESKFSDRLETSKHEHAKELEQVRFEINTLFNRVTNLHQKEFEVVPEAWSKLNDVLSRLRSFVHFFQQSLDLTKMSKERLDEFLSKSPFLESEKNELKSAKDINQKYQEMIFWHDYSEVGRLYNEFHFYLQKNRIFMSNDIGEQFTAIQGKMWNALMKRSIGKEANDSNMWIEASKQMREEIDPLLKEIEKLVQKRLQNCVLS